MFRGRYKLLRWANLALLVFLAQVGAMYAQSGQGQIAGAVKDSSGAVIPDASVTAVNERTAATRSAVANERGWYVIPTLQPSTYTLKAVATGFTVVEMKGVVLQASESLSLSFEMKPAGISESVIVDASTESALDTSSARIGTSVNEREVGDLPLNGRQLSQLYLQAPGSVNTGSGSFFDIRFSGRSNEQNAVRFDGVEASAIIDANPGNLNGELTSSFRLQTSLENVQEFRVDSSNYPAEYGTGSGGQISVVTKSGSNSLHGSAYEYVRNDVLDARNFFDKTGKSPLRLNQFGASAGGPIKQDKAFFFASYEGYRLRSGINFIEAVPSLSLKNLPTTAESVKPLIDAYHGPGSFVLPGASKDPNYDILQLPTSVQVDENAGAMRMDYNFNDRHSMYLRYMRDQGEMLSPEGVTGRITKYRAVPQNAVLAFRDSLTQTMFNEFKFGFNEALTRVAGTSPVINGLDTSKFAVNITGSVANSGIPGQGSSSGIAILGGQIRGSSSFNGSGFPYTPYSMSFIDSLSWIKGSHNLKFGGEIRLLTLYLNILGGTTYTYSNLTNFLNNTLQSAAYGGDLSDPSPFNNGATGNREGKTEFYIGFAQDEWKIRPNITLSYGLRYEYYTPLREANNLDVQFNIVDGTLFPPSRDFYKSVATNFGPRIGIAWSPNSRGNGWFGAGKTVLRAGFGLYYGPGQIEDQIQPIQSDRINSTITSGSLLKYPLDIPAVRSNFVNNPNNRSYQPRAYDPNYSVPERIYSFSGSVQQELPGKFNMTVAYVGHRGRNLFLRSWANKIMSVRADGTVIREFDIVNADGTISRPYAEIDYKTSGGRDSYDSMQVSFGRRLSRGLTLNSQYTWGRSFGNTSGSNDATTATDPFNFAADNGYNNFDIRQSFNVSAVYGLPFGKSMHGAAKALAGNWEIGTIVNARAGMPIPVQITRPDILYVDAAGNYYGSGGSGRTAVINVPFGGSSRNVRRPDIVAGVSPYLNQGGVTYLNPAAFAVPQPGKLGNMMRGSIKGPGFQQWDFTVNKRFPITETTNVQFRAEFFNILNHANFANPPAQLGNVIGVPTSSNPNQLQPGQAYTAATAGTGFGAFSSTVERTVGQGTNRQIQFALRLSF